VSKISIFLGDMIFLNWALIHRKDKKYAILINVTAPELPILVIFNISNKWNFGIDIIHSSKVLES
jgi:hypothetical protein